MLHILLTVLSVAGTVLLVTAGIAVFLILALLFVPVLYSGHVEKRKDVLKAGLKVSWMFRLVYVRIRYAEKHPEAEIYIFGIPVLRLKKYLDERKIRKRPPRKTVHRKPTVPPGGRKFRGPLPEVRVEYRREPDSGKTRRQSRIRRFVRKLAEVPGKIRERFRKIRFTIENICAKIREWYRFFTSRTFKRAWNTVKLHGLVMLRHILPKKVGGYVIFGLENPASTGQALGAAGILLPLIPEGLRIVPDFQEQRLEADITVRGRIVLFVLLRHGLAVYRDKYVQRVIKKFQHKEA